jgi:hypothetical protein
MANKDAPFGLKPVGELGSGYNTSGTTEYSIASGASGNIFSGDLVKMANTGTILVAAAGDQALGVFRGCKYTDSNGDVIFSAYWPDGTVTSDAVASTKTGISAVEISGTTAATSAQLRIVGFSGDPDNNTLGTGSQSANVNMIVKINEHFYAQTVGV